MQETNEVRLDVLGALLTIDSVAVGDCIQLQMSLAKEIPL